MQSTAIITQTTTKSLFTQIIGAAIFGIIMLYAVGFLATDVAHNAAHDTRHTFAFPCH
jgi:cobalt transporter subunit CbtB